MSAKFNIKESISRRPVAWQITVAVITVAFAMVLLSELQKATALIIPAYMILMFISSDPTFKEPTLSHPLFSKIDVGCYILCTATVVLASLGLLDPEIYEEIWWSPLTIGLISRLLFITR